MPDTPNELVLFRSRMLSTEQAENQLQEFRDLEEGLRRSQATMEEVLPLPAMDLTPEQKAVAGQQRDASVLLGAGVWLIQRCEPICPFRNECSLYRMRRHPLGQLCPFDVDYLRERFLGWLAQLGRELNTISESDRTTISTLCALDLELQRVRRVLSRAQNAEFNQLSVRDVNAETGEALCWENVIHTAAVQEMTIINQQRMILREYEMTPESQTRKAKALGIRNGNDIARKQSKLFEAIRARNRASAVDTTATPVT